MHVNNFPLGLLAECAPFLQAFGVTDARNYSKYQFKQLIKAKNKDHDRTEILEMARKYKKIDYDKVAEDDFNMKDYFKMLKVDFARSKFKIISHMMPLAMNQKS